MTTVHAVAIAMETGPVIVIDFDRLERDVMRGDNYVHIVNRSAYTVETNSHLVPEGAALCARKEMFRPSADFTIRNNGLVIRLDQHKTATCPGCLTKAKTVIVDYLRR